MSRDNPLILFTKPWPGLPMPALADLAVSEGFDGVELPVRDGFQVAPAEAAAKLPGAVRLFGERGAAVESVAGPLEERLVRAMGDSGVRLLRTMLPVDPGLGYRGTEAAFIRKVEALGPILRQSGVRVGLQNHYGNFVGSAAGLFRILEKLDPETAGAVLDPAHCSVAGEPVGLALGILDSRILMVNMKSCLFACTSSPDALESRYRVTWTTADRAIFSWREAVRGLRSQGFTGPFNVFAEYDGGDGRKLEGDAVLPGVRYDRDYLAYLLSDPGAEGSRSEFDRFRSEQSASTRGFQAHP